MQLSFYNDVRECGGELYLVGGCVRDALLGLKIKDYDVLIRGVPAVELEPILARHGRVEPVGKSFAVFKFVPEEGAEAIDVALPRIERSTGVGHRDFEVIGDPNLPVETDLGRRDFTINALAQEILSPEGELGEIVDPFGGRKDLENRVLRVVFERAFEEDPLRVLRGVQFVARFSLSVDPRTKDLMRKARPLLKTIAPERIIQEVGKLLRAPRPSEGFYLMRDIEALEELFPELAAMSGVEQPRPYHVADVFDHTMMAVDAAASDPEIHNAGDPELVLAALYHDVGKPECVLEHPKTGEPAFFGHENVSEEYALERLTRLKSGMIGADPDNVARLTKRHMFNVDAESSDKAIRRFIRMIGPDLVEKLIDLRIADRRAQANPGKIEDTLALRRRVEEELNRRSPMRVKELAISGHDLIDRGYKPGPAIGEELNRLLEFVLDDPEANTRERLLEELRPPPGERESESPSSPAESQR